MLKFVTFEGGRDVNTGKYLGRKDEEEYQGVEHPYSLEERIDKWRDSGSLGE